MTDNFTRRAFLGTVGAAAAAGAASAEKPEAGEAEGAKIRILGISCSPRAGKTTAASVRVCLEAAAKVSPRIETELIELAGMNIPVYDPDAKGPRGDFDKLAPRLTDPTVRGIIIGTPVYFGCMSSLAKAFLDHWTVFRKKFDLRNRVAGVAAVGSGRNGGQEITITSVQAALLAQEMIVVGDGQPTAHRGATLVNTKDDISSDEIGLATAKNLGTRVAEIALKLAGG